MREITIIPRVPCPRYDMNRPLYLCTQCKYHNGMELYINEEGKVSKVRCTYE